MVFEFWRISTINGYQYLVPGTSMRSFRGDHEMMPENTLSAECECKVFDAGHDRIHYR